MVGPLNSQVIDYHSHLIGSSTVTKKAPGLNEPSTKTGPPYGIYGCGIVS